MTFAEQIKTRAFWLRFVGIAVGAVFLVVAVNVVTSLLMLTTFGPWILGAVLVAAFAGMAYQGARDQ